MRTLIMILAATVVFQFCLPAAWAEGQNRPTTTQSRINWIQQSLDDGTTSAKLWQYGWTGIYGAATAFETYNASDKDEDDEEDERFDSTVNAVTSFLGFGSMLLDPLTSHSAAEHLRRMPVSTKREQEAKLAAAEKLLTACARRQERGRSWQTHAIAGAVSLLAGIAVACDDSREDDGLVMFASSMLVSEIQIFTMPTRAIDDLKNYQNQTFAKFRKKKPNRLFVNVIPGGLKFNYLF